MLNFTHNQVITSKIPSHTPENLAEIKNLITSVEWKGMRTLKVLPPLQRAIWQHAVKWDDVCP